MTYLIKLLRFTFLWSFLGLTFKNQAHATVTASGLAIIGYDDAEDSFTTLALEDISIGEVIYFTNNGWNSTSQTFNGADATQGAGGESIIKLSVTQNIAKGTVISSVASGPSWSWIKSGLIPGQVGGMAVFSDLALDNESDQIYAFQAPSANPLLNPATFLYALHFGSTDYLSFSDASDSLTGNIPPGLSLLAHNAFAHSDPNFHGDADGNNSAWGLNVNALAVQQLHASGGTSEQWRAVIANSAHWGSGQPSVSYLSVTPEPSRLILILGGFIACFGKRRRA